jgi:hypothetical protein
MGGIWVGDRSISDTQRKFMPTPDNVVRLPSLQEIQDQVRRGWCGRSAQHGIQAGWGAGLKYLLRLLSFIFSHGMCAC